MTENLVTITCSKCQARLKIKPNVFKIMKNLRCTKCGNGILLAPFAEAAREAAAAPVAPPVPTPLPAPADVLSTSTATAPAPTPVPEPAPLPSSPAQAPAPAPVLVPQPSAESLAEIAALTSELAAVKSELAAIKAELTELLNDKSGLKAEIEALGKKLKTTEFELGESDARVTSLQELWHSKELEAREMSARAQKAEQEAKSSTAQRDAFLARIKDELSMHLLKERDAALTRFAELEKKLLSLPPEVR